MVGQATVPWADSKEVGLLVGAAAVAAEVAVMLIPLGEAVHDGVSTSAVTPTLWPVEEEETYWWRVWEEERAQSWPPPERNERWMVV